MQKGELRVRVLIGYLRGEAIWKCLSPVPASWSFKRMAHEALGLDLSTLCGPVYVVDGDGVRVEGEMVRLAGLDAPEHDQTAELDNGDIVSHGEIVKNSLIQKIDRRHVVVTCERYDRYDRRVGTIHCGNEDINRWLVLSGYAIACYDDRYLAAQNIARKNRTGMWGYKKKFHPGAWRHGECKILR